MGKTSSHNGFKFSSFAEMKFIKMTDNRAIH